MILTTRQGNASRRALLIGVLTVAATLTFAAPAAAAPKKTGKVGEARFDLVAKAGHAGTCTYAGSKVRKITVKPPKAKAAPGYEFQFVKFIARLQGLKGKKWKTLDTEKAKTDTVHSSLKKLHGTRAFTTSNGVKPGYLAYRVVESITWFNKDGEDAGTQTVTLRKYHDGKRWISVCNQVPGRVSTLRQSHTSTSVTVKWRNPKTPYLHSVRVRVNIHSGISDPAYPKTPNSNKSASSQTSTSATVSRLPALTRVDFSIWARDESGHFSKVRHGSVLTPPSKPVVVKLDANTALGEVTQVSAGVESSCAVSNHELGCWGYNRTGVLGVRDYKNRKYATDVGGPVAQVSVGAFHACAVGTDHAVFCAGVGLDGQLGNGKMKSTNEFVTVRGLSDATAVAAGNFFSCALRQTGGVVCWGSNIFGQLGDNTHTSRSTPVPVHGLSSGVKAITVGGGPNTDDQRYGGHACALKTDGTVVCWGRNSLGQLGKGDYEDATTPQPVPGLTGVTGIAAGWAHTCATVTGGTVKCWGYNERGQLGHGNFVEKYNQPVSVSGLTNAESVSAGGVASCAVTANDRAYCWGTDVFGQVVGPWKDQSRFNYSVPQSVPGISGIATIDVGNTHVCAALNDGRVACWGSGYYGELGDGRGR